MAHIDTFQPGRFCWFELGTTDQAAAKRFYGELFGWSTNDLPLGPGQTYTMFQLQGRDVGACYSQMPEQRQQGIPPHWMTYIATTNVDQTAARAAELGAQLLMPGMDVFDSGRLAALMDPTGAAISIWQANKHIGVRVWGEVNSFCWSELMTGDCEAATRFYTQLFGWTTKVSPGGTLVGTPYTHWQCEGQDIGGMMQITESMGPVPPHWMNYVQVDDCDACVERAVRLGGTAMMHPTDIPNTGRFAILQDPQAAAFAVIKLLPMVK